MDLQSIAQSYQQNGFYVIKKLLTNQDFAASEEKILTEIRRSVFSEDIQDKEWIEHATKHPEHVSQLYDTMRDHPLFLDIGKNNRLVRYVENILGPCRLYKKVPFRIDVPLVTKELAFWHQDDYYVQGNEKELTAWIPFQNTTLFEGCLSVMPGSHLLGAVPHSRCIGKKMVPENVFDREVRFVEMQRGDVLLFSSYLLHSSNLNISEHIRYSVQLRYTSRHKPASTQMLGTLDVSTQ